MAESITGAAAAPAVMESDDAVPGAKNIVDGSWIDASPGRRMAVNVANSPVQANPARLPSCLGERVDARMASMVAYPTLHRIDGFWSMVLVRGLVLVVNVVSVLAKTSPMRDRSKVVTQILTNSEMTATPLPARFELKLT